MDLKDFQGIYKWKFLVPFVYIVNWVLIIVGPLFFPFAYQIYCMIIIVYSTLKTWGLCLGTLVSLIMLKRSLNKIKNIQPSNVQVGQQIYHAIVIPSYKQDEQVLLDTLNQLGKSSLAKTKFMVFLAMQAHEQKSDIKAAAIIQKSKHLFYHMGFTQHKVRQGQAKGKASNVSWCVQQFETLLQPLMLDMSKILITVLDADSWAPPEYFSMVELNLKQSPHLLNSCIFAAPQIYTRNHLEVPVFNRTFDTMHSLVQLANLVAVKFSFPLSNYSIGYQLIKSIGWWDTCADAIGQDFHTCQKSFWKSPVMHTCPIYVPFNQVSLATGQGYCKDIAARFWQAQRHTLGVSDVAYCCNMIWRSVFRFRNLWMTALVIQVFTMAAVIPWALLGLSLQYKIINDPSIQYFPGWAIQILLNAATFFTFVSYIFYQWWRRVANRDIYNKENDAWWRVFEYPVIFTFALFGFSIPSFIMASFAVLCTTTEYRVAQKHIQKNQQANEPAVIVKHKTLQKKGSLLKKISLNEPPRKKSNKISNETLQIQKSNQPPNHFQISSTHLSNPEKPQIQNQTRNHSGSGSRSGSHSGAGTGSGSGQNSASVTENNGSDSSNEQQEQERSGRRGKKGKKQQHY